MNFSDTKRLSKADSAPQAGSKDLTYQLVYVSIAKNKFSQQNLESILETSRKYNPTHQITGLLLYSNGNVLQILEGAKNDVHDLYERIQVDPRHHKVKMLSFLKVPKRDFSDWSMGFKRIDEATFNREIPNFSDIIERKSLNLETLAGFSIRVGFLLKNFSLMNRLDDLKKVN
jgi:hypothetical protein